MNPGPRAGRDDPAGPGGWPAGDGGAAEELLPLVYRELRALAAAKLSRERPGQTLQPTALVHEAYLRLLGDSRERWDSRSQFFAAAAEAMRRLLVENARRKASLKRGGDCLRVDWSEVQSAIETDEVRLLEVEEALQRLEREDEASARLVGLRFFAGLSVAEAAKVMDLSERTAARLWTHARAWLLRELRKGG